MEQVNAKSVALFVAVACLIGIAIGSAVTFALMQRAYSLPSSGMVVAVNVGVFSDSAATQNLTAIS